VWKVLAGFLWEPARFNLYIVEVGVRLVFPASRIRKCQDGNFNDPTMKGESAFNFKRVENSGFSP